MNESLFDAPREDMERSAEFSKDRKYRYVLRRIWDRSLPPVLFIGYNPSTADETEDDPTIRRCIRFARDWGYGGLLMGNLFAYRATDPKVIQGAMEASFDPISERTEGYTLQSPGPGKRWNDIWLQGMHAEAGITIAAWGSIALPKAWGSRANHVHQMLGVVHALGFTQDGMPRHPLYMPVASHPVPMPTHEHKWGPWRMYEGSMEKRWCETCGEMQVD